MSNNRSTALQTDKLIVAARTNAGSASRYANSASRFADSAHSIDDGITEAVQKLNLQAKATAGVLSQTAIQAKAGTRVASVAQQALISDAHSQRAWIGLQAARIVSVGPNMPLRIEIDFVNAGRTPAVSVRSGAYPLFLRAARSERSKREEVAKARKLIEFLPDQSIVPQQIFTLKLASDSAQYDSGLTREAINDILSGKVSIYFPGRIEFDDIFGRHQWLEFCLRVANTGTAVEILACPFTDSELSYQPDTNGKAF